MPVAVVYIILTSRRSALFSHWRETGLLVKACAVVKMRAEWKVRRGACQIVHAGMRVIKARAHALRPAAAAAGPAGPPAPKMTNTLREMTHYCAREYVFSGFGRFICHREKIRATACATGARLSGA